MCGENEMKLKKAEKEQSQNLYESLGVSIFHDAEITDEYKKVEGSLTAELDQFVKMIPSAYNMKNLEGTYRAHYDKGLGVLQKSKKNPGYLYGRIVDPKTNGNMKSEVLWEQVGKGAQAIETAFSLASLAVGQYYMSQIDKRMNGIDSRLDSVQQFLEDDKKSELSGREKFMLQTQKDMLAIYRDEKLRNSKLSQIQDNLEKTGGFIDFYRKQVVSALKSLNPQKDKEKDAQKKIGEILEDISLYYYSVYLYEYACSLEVFISANGDEEYLDSVVEKMTNTLKEFAADKEDWLVQLSDYITDLKILSPNVFFLTMSCCKNSKTHDKTAKAVLDLFGFIGNKLSKSDIKKKTIQKNSLDNLLGISLDTDIIMEKINNVIMFNSINNQPVDIVSKDGEMFIKSEAESVLESYIAKV